MKKTAKNIKHRFFIKGCIIFAAIQLVFISLVIFSFCVNTLNYSDIKNATVIVEKTEYVQKPFVSGRMFAFYADSTKYYFPKFAIWGTNEYSMEELKETISVGDILSISYIEKNTDGVKKSIVLEARSNDDVYRSIEAYQSFLKGQNIIAILMFLIIESLLLFVFRLYVIFYYRN